MDFKASLNNLRISPRKVRVVADTVRGKSVYEAEQILMHINRKPAVPLKKVILSAAANAQHTKGVDFSQLAISHISVDEGPTLKRFQPRAFGRACMIRKRTSHVNVVLSDQGFN